jgi:hypothetical protein
LPERDAATDAAPDPTALLRDVLAWVLVNTLRLEAAQQALLTQQSLAYVWRKQAFRSLVAHATQLAAAATAPPAAEPMSMSVFREPVDYDVANVPPTPGSVEARLAQTAATHQHWLATDEQRAIVESLLEAARVGGVGLAPSEAHGSLDLTREQVQEDEEEQEQEQEQVRWGAATELDRPSWLTGVPHTSASGPTFCGWLQALGPRESLRARTHLQTGPAACIACLVLIIIQR